MTWIRNGEPVSTILDFIELPKSHTGRNMARALVETLERYGIAHKVSTYGIREETSSPKIQTGSITADNATNNGKLMDELENLLRAYSFRGCAQHIHCFAHTLNLAAKATIRQFERKKRKLEKTQG